MTAASAGLRVAFDLPPMRRSYSQLELARSSGSQPGGKDEISGGAFRAHDNRGRVDVPTLDAPIDLPNFRPSRRQPWPYKSAGEREVVFVRGILAPR